MSKKLAILLTQILIFTNLFSTTFDKDNLEEAIIELELVNKIEYIEAFISSEDDSIYITTESFYEYFEVPDDKKLPNEEEYINLSVLKGSDYNYFESFQWDYFTAILKIDPIWKTKQEIEDEILRNRERLDKKSDEKEYNIEKEEWKFFTPGILNLGLTHDSSNKEDFRGYFNYSNNFLYGYLNLSGSIENMNASLENVRWERNMASDRKLIVGEFYSSNKFNIGNSYNVTGVSLQNKNSWRYSLSKSAKEVKGIAPNGSVVELYRNNILEKYTYTENGEYKFSLDLNSGKNQYKIKIYLPDGEILEKSLSLYGDEDLLKAKEFDYSFDMGKKKNEDIYNFNVKYGLFDNLTLNAGTFNSFDSLGNSDRFFSVGEIGSIYIPFFNIPLLHDFNLAFNDELKPIYYLNLKTDKFGFNFNYTYKNSKNLSERFAYLSDSVEKSRFEIAKTYRGFNLSFGHESSVNFFNNRSDSTYFNLGRGYGKGYYNVGLNYEDNLFNADLGFHYGLGKKYLDNISLNYNFSNHSAFSIFFDLGKTFGDSNWSYNLSYSHDEKKGSAFGFTFEWTPGKKIKYRNRATYEKGYSNIETSVETNIYFSDNKIKVSYDRSFGTGSANGVVYLDKNGNNIFDEGDIPLDATIRYDGNKKEVNSEGEYELIGINTHSPILTEVTLNDQFLAYDVDPTITTKLEVNPGGNFKKDFAFAPKTTVIYNIIFPDDYYYEDVLKALEILEVSLLSKNSNKTETFKWVDSESYFKDFNIGEYSIDVKGNEFFNVEKITGSKNFKLNSEEVKILNFIISRSENGYIIDVQEEII